MSPNKFKRAMEFLISSEGGNNADPTDRGGLTKYGISQKQYPDLDIRALTRFQVDAIYENDYWNKLRCSDMVEPLAIVVFDSGVNCGRSSAAKWLQQACNRLGSNLVVDGIVGPVTFVAVNQYNHRALLEAVVAQRLRRYAYLLKKHPEQVKYIRGWILRVAALLMYV